MKNLKKLASCAIASALLVLTIIPTFSSDIAYAEPETKLIALTFDDGPNTTTTNEVLDILEEYNAKASFFLIGTNINEDSAKSVKRAYDMGMEIDNHSKTHSNMSKMTPEEIQEEIAYVDEKVVDIIGEPTKFFRPPFIDTSDTMYDAIDIPFICGIDCQDYMPNVLAEERAQYILNGAKDGVIVLLHDAAGNEETVKALEIVMPELVKQGYEFVTLTELFERQGETPKHHILYSNVAKYPCSDYELYQEIPSDTTEKIMLDAQLLEKLNGDYAIEVNYSSKEYAPVIALQRWSSTPSIWKAVQPFYFNGDKAVFLASDIVSALKELDIEYSDLDGMALSAYGGEITLSDAKLLVKSEPSEMLMGDVNDDGKFSLADLIMLQKWIHCNGTLTNWKTADFNHDNVVNVIDLSLMKRQLLH